MKKAKHKTVPVFIPHYGCPHKCVFCDQVKITGMSFKEQNAKNTIDYYLAHMSGRADEIAFFGGSFTGIDRDLMIRLLKLGRSYIESGAVSAMRCSTRPDFIDGEILGILKEYGLETVELGVQSTDDEVLRLCRRGHTAKQSLDAMKLLKENGFTAVGQMMTGLPGATPESEIKTALDICGYADAARIYPIVVFKHTELCEMVYRGEYKLIDEDELIARTADVKEVFVSRGVPTIRIGLQSQTSLHGDSLVYAARYDDAIGEKCESLIYYRRIRPLLEGLSGAVTVRVPEGDISKAVGHKKANKERLIKETAVTDIKFIEGDLPPYTAEIVG